MLQKTSSIVGQMIASDELEPDDSYLSELALLAGDASDTMALTEAALEKLGWTRGVLVADTTLQSVGMMDHAKTFSKNGKCIATFGAVNDDMDKQQVLGGLAADPINFCGFKMQAGVVDEMVGFMKAPNWNDFITYLNSPNCTSVTAVGHSLGGALATMFAGCANVGGNNGGFGARKDYGLVVYAPFGVATEPIYSGTPGTPFVGRRYGITESDGGVSSKASLPQNTTQMRLDTLKLYVDLTKAMDNPAATQLSQAYQQFLTLPASQIEPAWDQLSPKLVPFLLPTFQIASAPPPGLELFQPKVLQMLDGMAKRGELFFSSDFISSLSQAYGYKHALVDFQPMANPNRPTSDITYTKVVAAQGAPELPNLDPFQGLFTIMASGGEFPNHRICCYASASGCKTMFTEPWAECLNTPFR